MKLLILFVLIFTNISAFAIDHYISSSTGSDLNDGSKAHPWFSVLKYKLGDHYFFKCGDVFNNVHIPSLTATGETQRILISKYGVGASPVLDGFSKINAAAWVLYSPNIWVATVTNSLYVTGTVTTISNSGMLVVNGLHSGYRSADIAGLNQQWEFYCDFQDKLYVYSTQNPSKLASSILIQANDRPIHFGNYITIQYLQLQGYSETGFSAIRPIRDTISHCRILYCGGQMKSTTNSTRQGGGISFANGGTNSLMYYDTVEHSYDEGVTWQTHTGGGGDIPFTNCVIRKCVTDSCELSFSAAIAVLGAHGFIRCKVDSCIFKLDGYSWSHFSRPADNAAITLLTNFWWQVTSERDIILEHCTFICPREGVYYFDKDAADPLYVTRNNTIYMDSNILIRRNYQGKTTPFSYKLKDHVQFTTDLGYEVGSTWLWCGSVPADTIPVLPPPTDTTIYKTYFKDNDGDNFGDPLMPSPPVTGIPVGYVEDSTDCNDNDPTIYPGAPELPDGKDNNCDGISDNIFIYYRDNDRDGYGNVADTIMSYLSLPPMGYIYDHTDCDDNNATVYPGAKEILDGLDNNCNGTIDEGCVKYRNPRYLP